MQMKVGLVLLMTLYLDSGLSLLHLRLKTRLINVMRFASSTSTFNTRPEEARWSSARAWCAALRTNPKRSIHLEVDLGKEYDIRRIETLGWSAVKRKTRRFILQYKKHGKWVPYLETLRIKVFKGGFCHSSCVPSPHPLKEPIIAQHLRFYPFSTQDEVGCLKVRFYGTKPLVDDCARVGTHVIVKHTNDRPISFMPGRILGFSRHHIYVRVTNSKAILRVNKDEDNAIILNKRLDRWSLRPRDQVLALFSPFDRLYEASILYTSSPPGHAMVQNEAFFSPSEWLKYNYLRLLKQAHLCYCPSCSCPVPSSLNVSCHMDKSSFDYGLVFRPLQITELWRGRSRNLSGRVTKVIFNKRRTYIQPGRIQRFSYQPTIINSCLCPPFQADTNYVIFGFVRNRELVLDSSSYLKEVDDSRADSYQNICNALGLL